MYDHPDAQQDLDQLRPILEMIMGRITALENLTEKIVTGFSGAVTTQKKRSLLGSLREKHGATLGGIEDIYKDLVGGDPFEDLVNKLMEFRDTDEYAPEMEDGKIEELIQTLLAKFGKYAPKPMEVETTTIEVEPEEEEVKPKQPELRLVGDRI